MPEASPWFSVFYFAAYIFIAGFLMLNLFIGVIMVRFELLHLHSFHCLFWTLFW